MAYRQAAGLAVLIFTAWMGTAGAVEGTRPQGQSAEAVFAAVPPAAGGLGSSVARPTEPPPGQPGPAPIGPQQRPDLYGGPAMRSAPPAGIAPSRPPKPADAPSPVKVSGDPRPALDPATFINTVRAAERHLAVAEAGGWPVLPAGTPLKLGDRGSVVSLLRRRLAASEDLRPDSAPGDVFDAPLLAAVKRFQFRHGLPETGTVAERTLQALNVPAETRARQLAASAQRLAGSAFPFGERYVVVNIPSATVEAVENGQVRRRHVAVVGKADRPSPAVETRITAVNLNPTWTVPVSLIRKDIIPQMRKDPSYLSAQRIRVLDGVGGAVDPAAIDWSTEKAVNYTLRQDPGADNSLGRVRIDMPNRHAVFLHDTPSKRLFAQAARFHSSGCVRVADVEAFAAWLLEATPGPNGAWTPFEIAAGIASGERLDVKLAKPVPVAWVYLTGYATPDGGGAFPRRRVRAGRRPGACGASAGRDADVQHRSPGELSLPLPNRVDPCGELIETHAKGDFFGNRGGRIHDPATRTLTARRWASSRWICCLLRFRERPSREVWATTGYTELFFLDEVTALAAGHRPCFECRRADARAFGDAVAAGPARPRLGIDALMPRCIASASTAGASGSTFSTRRFCRTAPW
jgi:peptidoglycan hydrolase-like protein with peptidoglycan-binding domain